MPARIYPWESWFAKSRLHLVKGKDFDVEPYVMAQTVRNNARAYLPEGKTLSIQIGLDHIEVSINKAQSK